MISCVVGRTVMTLFITCLGDNLILSIHVLLESHKPALMQDHRNHIVIYHCLLSPVLIGFRFTQNFKAFFAINILTYQTLKNSLISEQAEPNMN